MGVIITRELIEDAIDSMRNPASDLFSNPDAIWGPQWVEGIITAPGLEGNYMFRLGTPIPWDEAWGEERHFAPVAQKKHQLIARLPQYIYTSVIARDFPWLVEAGEYLYPGGVSKHGITAALSGIKGWGDELLANGLVDKVIELSLLEVQSRVANKQMLI